MKNVDSAWENHKSKMALLSYTPKGEFLDFGASAIRAHITLLLWTLGASPVARFHAEDMFREINS